MKLDTQLSLFKEVIRRSYINAKRQKKSINNENFDQRFLGHWEGQEIAFKQLLDILEE